MSEYSKSPAHDTTPVRHLRAIRDEEQPAYDADHPAPGRVTFRMVPDPVLDLRDSDATHVYANLLRLARSSDTCTVSYAALGKLCGLSPRQVRYTVLFLEARGLLYVTQRAEGGMKLPNQYTLVGHKSRERTDAQSVHNPMQDVQGGYAPHAQPYAQPAHVKETVNGDIKRLNPPTPQTTSVPTDQTCEAFIAAYPAGRRGSVTTVRRMWVAMNLDPGTIQRIMGDVERRKGSHDWRKEEGRYIPKAEKYLDERQWEAAPVVPFAGIPEEVLTPKQRMARNGGLV